MDAGADGATRTGRGMRTMPSRRRALLPRRYACSLVIMPEHGEINTGGVRGWGGGGGGFKMARDKFWPETGLSSRV